MRTGVPSRSCLLALGLLLGTRLPASAAPSVSLASASGYGNFHAGGVVVTIVGDDNFNASVTLEWRPTGGTFRLGHPPLRIDATHFAGSLFWLSPGTSYDVRLTLSDPDGVTGPATTVVPLQTRGDTLPALAALQALGAGPPGGFYFDGTTLTGGAVLTSVTDASWKIVGPR